MSSMDPLLHSHPHSPALPSPAPSPSNLRLRQVAQAVPVEEEPDKVRRLVRSLKTLDVYPKTEEDIAVKTGSGGLISIVSAIIITLLVLTQLYAFLSPKTTHSILVDTRPSAKLQIHFDLTFHALRCSDTSIDVMDVSGDTQVAAVKNIHRVRLTADGEPIGEAYEDRAHDGEPQPEAINPMLQAMGMGFPPRGMGGPDNHEDQRGEGCNIVGTLLVNKVAGNVHVALGGQHSHSGSDEHTEEEGPSHSSAHGDHSHGSHGHGDTGQQHVHQFMIHDLANYNCSHTIRRLGFGPQFPGQINPLDGVSQIIPEGGGTAHYQYFVKVVPTVYEDSFGNVQDTNQYSVTQQTQLISVQDAFQGNAQRIPGLFLVYDLSPFMVRVSERRTPLSTFITSIFAIVGGVLTVAGVIDSLLFASAKVLKVTSPIAKK